MRDRWARSPFEASAPDYLNVLRRYVQSLLAAQHPLISHGVGAPNLQGPQRFLYGRRDPNPLRQFELLRSENWSADRARGEEIRLCGVRPVWDSSRSGRLKSPVHMEFTVRAAIRLRFTAEVEVELNGVAEGPSAIARLKARYRLSLAEWDRQVIGLERRR